MSDEQNLLDGGDVVEDSSSNFSASLQQQLFEQHKIESIQESRPVQEGLMSDADFTSSSVAENAGSNINLRMIVPSPRSDAEDVPEELTQGTPTPPPAAISASPDEVDGDVAESLVDAAPEANLVEVSIGPEHFDLLKLIGEGAFGKVILVRNKMNKKLYAMKVISKALLKKKNNVQYMKSERDILTMVEHPFIVKLYFAFQSEKKLFLVMEFLSGGELFYHLRLRGLILENEVRFYLGEIILALEFLHELGIIHRDLKPENLLLRQDGHICLTDFGLAKEIGEDRQARTLCGTSEYMVCLFKFAFQFSKIKNKYFLKKNIYITHIFFFCYFFVVKFQTTNNKQKAPEMIARNAYGPAVDWWSVGALCYEMLVGKAPFVAKNEKELFKKILTEKFTCPPYLTAPAISILKGLLEKDSYVKI